MLATVAMGETAGMPRSQMQVEICRGTFAYRQ